MAAANALNGRLFIGGSDARVIMSLDAAALIRLWKEKCGEVEPMDLRDNLVLQLGIVTEALNRSWYEPTPSAPSPTVSARSSIR
jgi:predicted phage-related endonuclease